MRIYLTAFCCLAALFGASAYGQEDSAADNPDSRISAEPDSADIKNDADAEEVSDESQMFLKGMEFYAQGDFDSAKSFLKEIPANDTPLSATAAFYLGNIAAYEGDPAAEALFERALKNIPEILRPEVLVNYARYEIANEKFSKAAEILADVAPSTSDTFIKWLYADSLWLAGEKEKAAGELAEFLQKSFSDETAIGVDIFIEDRLENNPLAQAIDISQLKAENEVSKARLEMLEGKPITEPFQNVSLLAQIAIAETDGIKDVSIFESSLEKYGQAPYAWRGYLELARTAFREKDYEKARYLARYAEFIAPPIIEYQWPCIMLQGDAYRMMKLYDTARECYLKIAMSGNLNGEPIAESLYKTGLCWFEQGKWSTAYAYFERVFFGYFKFEYWGARAYLYGAQCLHSENMKLEGNMILVEYFRRAKEKDTPIYKEIEAYFNETRK